MTGNVNIMLVEDDLDDQKFFVEAICLIENATLYGISDNGKEALERLQDQEKLPDIIFMDINMPRMNGIDCLKAIHANPLTTDIPIVMLSTSAGESAISQLIGAKGFITKPISLESLQHLVSSMIVNVPRAALRIIPLL
ncbi:MAG: response regulator [Bacteroidota bacterium]|nr:response regulator [Bacteroidota bacterium]